MIAHLSPLCPSCHQPLPSVDTAGVTCPGCGQNITTTLGILDLRGPSATNDPTDQHITKQLVKNFAGKSFGELLEIRLRNAPTYQDLRGHEMGYFTTLAERGRIMVEMFQQRAAEIFPFPERTAALDIGCGHGASLLTLARQFQIVVGIDPSLPDLILARKALDESGITNVQLIQAYGQQIAYPSESFDYINALNVLEHVMEPQPVLQECQRLLRVGGIFAGDSRNRFDVFFREPHVKIRWVGFVPLRWVKRYVYWRTKAGYEHTRLLSYGEVRSSLRACAALNSRMVFPYVDAYGGPNRLNRWLRSIERIPLLSTFLLAIFPSHLVLAQKR